MRIAVADDGIGISRAHRDKIFDAFFTTKQEVSGVGLWLFVCYGIVQQHHGTITVESEEGQGATFIIDIPVERHDTAEHPAP